MAKDVIVSFVIPCLNGEPFISRCLDSLLNLTNENWEAIIVDNGSEDKSCEILSAYAKKDERFTVLKSSVKCQSTSKNIAIEKVSGKYVCFVDIDDAVSSDLLNSYPIQENYDFYFSNWKKIKNGRSTKIEMPMNDGYFGRTEILRIHKWIFGDVLSKNPLSIDVFSSNCGKLYKTSIIRKNKINFVPMKEIGGSEDAIFNMEYLNFANNGYFAKKELYYYYSHDGSYTHKRSLQDLFLYYSQYHIMNKLVQKLNLDSSYETALKNRLVIVSLPVFLVASRLKASKKEKFVFFREYLSYKDFDEALESFKVKRFGFIYKFLYYLLTRKHYKCLYHTLKAMDTIYAHKN